MGRIDEQVKIRGFRIELGEIESALRKIEGIKDAAVIAKENGTGDKELCAYIVSEEEMNINEVKEGIRKELPEYMVPALMMQIDSLPLTRNGKLDKRALPKIEMVREETYAAPRNAVEEALAEVFEKILGIEKVGIKDNFFELGGHSLRATRLVNEIEAKTGVRLPLKDIFSYSTVEKIVERIGEIEKENYKPIPKAEEKEAYEMSSTQKRTYILNEMDKEKLAYNMPAAFEMQEDVDLEKLTRVFNQLIERHEILRTSFHMEEGELVQKIEKNIDFKIDYENNYEEIHYKEIAYEEMELCKENVKRAIKDFVRPFNLGQAPMMRVKVIKDKDRNILMFDMHHIISDGKTMNILVEELGKLYKGKSLEDIKVQYKDYSEWIRERDISKQKEYWLKVFSDEIPVLDLPLDYKRGQEQSFKGDRVNYQLSKEIKEKVEKLTKKAGTTEYMVLLASIMVLLQKYSRQEDIVIGSPISGRTHKDTEEMMGMFVNTLAMRAKPEGEKSFKSFLEEIKEISLNAYENQEYPFEELVEAVKYKKRYEQKSVI